MMPQIDNNFEKFDSTKYNYLYSKDPFNTTETLSDGTYMEMLSVNAGKYYKRTPKNSYFMISKSFYPNGNIKSKGLSSNTGYFQKGVWYEFDEQGRLIKEVDYDKPFKFTFEDVLKFCNKRNIKIEKGSISQNGWHNIISRKIENGHPIWRIEYLKQPNLTEIITLDGITGKVLKQETEEYINN
ncbi:hypothetical protein [Chryseobacterium wanjuense]